MSQVKVAASRAHIRENHGLLARIEKEVLVWLAVRLPSWTSSDHLSALGLAGMLAVGLSFAAFRLTSWAAAGVLAFLAINWFGDSLDGTVARVRGQERPRYGYYVDHVIDLAGMTFLTAGLAYSGLMSPMLAALLLAAYLLVSAETYLATHACGVFRMSFMGIGPTELRVVLAAGAFKAAHDPWITFGEGQILLFNLGAIVAIAGLAGVFVASAVRNARALYAMEPLPKRSGTSAAA